MSILRSEIGIAAPPDVVYRFASQTERWPAWLPHYRRVRVLEGDDTWRLVEMAAWRDAIPISWRARQRNDPSEPSIRFVHVTGWARGMNVEWRFDGDGAGTRVSIVHDVTDVHFPILREVFARDVVGRFFVENVAAKTLARFKLLAETTGYA